MINVLYVTFASENFDGATYSLMDLIKSVKEYVKPIVMVGTEGCARAMEWNALCATLRKTWLANL